MPRVTALIRGRASQMLVGLASKSVLLTMRLCCPHHSPHRNLSKIPVCSRHSLKQSSLPLLTGGSSNSLVLPTEPSPSFISPKKTIIELTHRGRILDAGSSCHHPVLLYGRESSKVTSQLLHTPVQQAGGETNPEPLKAPTPWLLSKGKAVIGA